ncbi:MAG TPA: PHP domain-containing protein, partial [Actinomycetota bacterium]|nr:PHP domain-containing protein [Actinomycetota bacterium]
MASPSFVHLDVRSFFSLKEGAFSPEDLARRAAHLGMPAVALTDRDGLYGAARFVEACGNHGVKPILGASVTTGTDTSVTLVARDDAGYANLCRLITDAHMVGERGEPSVTAEQVCAHAGGLVALLGPSSSVGRLATRGRLDAALTALSPFHDAFGSRLHVAVEQRLERSSRDEIRALLRLADRAGVRAAATNPV